MFLTLTIWMYLRVRRLDKATYGLPNGKHTQERPGSITTIEVNHGNLAEYFGR